jgi:hypothetical protein
VAVNIDDPAIGEDAPEKPEAQVQGWYIHNLFNAVMD